MNLQQNDNMLRSYYDTFDARHDMCRRELLNLLSCTPIAAHPNNASHLPKWLTYSRLAVAALLLVAIGLLLSLGGGTPQTVYGMEHLAERLMTIRSLYLKGWIYQTITSENGDEKLEKFPTELYARRPNCLGYRSYGFSIPGGGKPSTVTSAYMASNGKETIVVSDDKREATIANVAGDAFYTELMVESFIQSSIASNFLQGPPEYYRKIRSVDFQGVLCDVYEFDQEEVPFAFAGRHRVWLNRLTGIPMKSETNTVDESGVEKLSTRDVIQVDVEPPVSLFSFQAPQDYKLIKLDANKAEDLDMQGIKLSPYGEGGSDTTWLGSWHSLNVEERAVLACWYQYDTKEGEKVFFARQPTFEFCQGNRSRSCREHTISTNKVNDTHWRWSLILPDDNEPVGEYMLSIKVADEKTRTSQELKPLRFPRERLQEIIFEAQRRTLPNKSRQELFSLVDIESIE
ncbi:hypothetical protein [Bythopirellula polymerisocia]|uniref:Uncharacterized protein n=1 Tax=Bythopirellula polymerisocia TaxID=2528003 RepID=A0A5C6CKW9_9BACT|nr:hypothetical protein [Bythopirellula polymerisocia]TWU25513.1 hypothetical protein Pla144_27180 [Bythopirellula polymerisocia]